METKLWQVASGKWQVASGKWQVAKIRVLWLVVKQKLKLNDAFTLIELSIVLVIIGLVIGGVLVGQDLIKAAAIRSSISDIERIQTSVNTFKLKYNCIPGDCANATAYFPSATNGNGDGMIGVFPGITYGEVWQFWYHLQQANLWSGTFTGTTDFVTCGSRFRHAIVGVNVPASKMGNTIGYTVVYWGGYTDANDFSGSGGYKTIKSHSILFGTSDGNICETYGTAFTTIDALSMDTKVDDGKPATGNWISTPYPFNPNCATSNNSTVAVYNIASKGISCGFLINAGF